MNRISTFSGVPIFLLCDKYRQLLKKENRFCTIVYKGRRSHSGKALTKYPYVSNDMLTAVRCYFDNAGPG